MLAFSEFYFGLVVSLVMVGGYFIIDKTVNNETPIEVITEETIIL